MATKYDLPTSKEIEDWKELHRKGCFLELGGLEAVPRLTIYIEELNIELEDKEREIRILQKKLDKDNSFY
jgi:hypothetical protein